MPQLNLSYPDGDSIAFVSSPDKSKHPYSRYRNLNRMTTTEQQTFIETFKNYAIDSSTGDQFHYVEPGEENRLDLIAYKYYKLPQLWWVLAMANSLTDPLTVPVGTQLRIPDMHTLYHYGGILA